MSFLGKARVGLLAVAAVCLLAGLGYGSGSMVPRPLWCDIEVLDYNPVNGYVQVEASVYFRDYHPFLTNCELVAVSIDDLDGLEYNGPEAWNAYVDSVTAWTTRLNLIVPRDDTSGFIMRTVCGKVDRTWRHYFVTEGDSLYVYRGDPRKWIGTGEPLPLEEQRRRLKEQQDEYIRKLREQAPDTPYIGHGHRGLHVPPADSALFDSLSEKGKRKLSVMRMRERDPLEGQPVEWFIIDNRWFRRYEGEHRFQRVESYTAEESREQIKRYHDSLDVALADREYDVVLDLRNEDDYKLAKSLVERMEPVEDSGFFRAWIVRKNLIQLIEAGIEYSRTR